MKIEQVAYGTTNIDYAMEALSTKLGIQGWVEDRVIAEGIICGRKGMNVARLAFNYDLGFELELLQYLDGPNWHDLLRRNPAKEQVFLSHMGLHVDDIDKAMQDYVFSIAQQVTTLRHTNPIADARKYRYVVYDSRPLIGFDLKLIQRINKDAA